MAYDARQLVQLIECATDMLDLVVVQVQVLQLCEGTKDSRIYMGDEVLAEAEPFQMLVEAGQS